MFNNALIIIYSIISLFNIYYVVSYLRTGKSNHSLWMIINSILIYGNPFINRFVDHNIYQYVDDFQISSLVFILRISFFTSSIIFVKETFDIKILSSIIEFSVFLIIAYYLMSNIDLGRSSLSDSYQTFISNPEISLLNTILVIYRFWIFPLLVWFILVFWKIWFTDQYIIKEIILILLYIVFIYSSFVVVMGLDQQIFYCCIESILSDAAVFLAIILFMRTHMRYQILDITEEKAYFDINKVVRNYRTFLIILAIVSFVTYYTSFEINEIINWMISGAVLWILGRFLKGSKFDKKVDNVLNKFKISDSN